MSRLAALKQETLSPEQAKVYAEIEAKGGRLGGPYNAYIRIPGFMRLNQEMGDYLRKNSLSGSLRQLIVLTTVKHWGAKYAWTVNARSAEKEGLSRAIVEAIEKGQEPGFKETKERLAWTVARELLNNKVISDATYKEAVDVFGEASLADVVVTTGFYSMVSMTLNAFDIDPPSAQA